MTIGKIHLETSCQGNRLLFSILKCKVSLQRQYMGTYYAFHALTQRSHSLSSISGDGPEGPVASTGGT